ncbi:MAG: hypothetical protein ACKOPS_28435, partial [Cyanobium sp.]
MAFDPRSLERLRELGRSLPQPLPKPEPKAQPSTRAKAAEPRHKVETETDPEQLFRELMQASADGTVPPHLLERLRQVEGQRRQRPTAASASSTSCSPSTGSNLLRRSIASTSRIGSSPSCPASASRRGTLVKSAPVI